jgi:hypothetical protein
MLLCATFAWSAPDALVPLKPRVAVSGQGVQSGHYTYFNITIM